jgi:hypothetical protein
VVTWSPPQLAAIDGAGELEIAVRRTDGGPGRWTPIWVVVVGQDVLVRTWHRRDAGWYGRAVRSGAASIRVPGASAEVRVEPVGEERREAVGAAYRRKYGVGGAESMTTDEAAASTLLLRPESIEA